MTKDSPDFFVLEAFQNKLGLFFKDQLLLELALTHRSFVNEEGEAPWGHNERLEFLGDAVLGEVVAHFLYLRFPEGSEGELSRLKSLLVSEASLAELAADLGLPEALRLGRGEELSGGRQKRAIAADAFEALVGAIFLDQGGEAAETFVKSYLAPRAEKVLLGPSKDFKTMAQEYAQKYLGALPAYRLEASEGPDHARTFLVSCALGALKVGPCPGRTKKEAEQAAAKALIEELKKDQVAALRLAEWQRA